MQDPGQFAGTRGGAPPDLRKTCDSPLHHHQLNSNQHVGPLKVSDPRQGGRRRWMWVLGKPHCKLHRQAPSANTNRSARPAHQLEPAHEQHRVVPRWRHHRSRGYAGPLRATEAGRRHPHSFSPLQPAACDSRQGQCTGHQEPAEGVAGRGSQGFCVHELC